MKDYINKCVRFKGFIKEACKEGDNYIIHFKSGTLYVQSKQIEWLFEKGEDINQAIVAGLKQVNQAQLEKIIIEL